MDNTESLDMEKIIQQAVQRAVECIPKELGTAEVILKQVLRCSPNRPEALTLLGITLLNLNKNVESIEVSRVAIDLLPSNPDNYNNVSLAYNNIGQYQKSLEFAKKAIILQPNSAILYNNIAIPLRYLKHYDEAIKCLKQAIAIEEDAPIWTNLGGVYGEMKDMRAAEPCFLKAIELNPNYAPAHVDLSFTYYFLDDYPKGFKEYEWRTQHFPQMEYYNKLYDQSKRWRSPDESVEGKTILIYAEQGLGDFIMAIRWLKLLKAQNPAKIIIHCDENFNTLLTQVQEVDQVINRDLVTGEGDEIPQYDIQCCVMSLPYLLQRFDTSGEPYLKPSTKANIKRNYPDTFNIGICWAGSAHHPHDEWRSTFLKYFKVFQLPGVKLFSLQKDTRPRIKQGDKIATDFMQDGNDMQIVNMASFMTDLAATTAIIGGLDLIITVDTALLHLCGATGVPCWGLLAFKPDWRWGLTGETTKWYDSVKLFRQEKFGDWEGVFSQVAKKLSERLAI
jgi:tetratricopeptide (TPR) repeat protein